MDNKTKLNREIKALNKARVRRSVSVKAHYSGNASKDFWNIVNAIKDDADRQELYSLGVALQNMEGYVLKQLQHIKRSYVRGQKHYA